MSFDSLESSRDASFKGFFGNSQAATIVVRAAISGPVNATRVIGPVSLLCDGEHAAPHMRKRIAGNEMKPLMMSE